MTTTVSSTAANLPQTDHATHPQSGQVTAPDEASVPSVETIAPAARPSPPPQTSQGEASESEQHDDTAPAARSDGPRKISWVFIHSELDDYGLSPAEFRVYSHIARRAGAGYAWSSVGSIARTCRLHSKTVRAALQFLVTNRLLTREDRPGYTSRFQLTPPTQWVPHTPTEHHHCQTDTPVSEDNPCQSDTIVSEGQCSPAKRSHGCPSQSEPGQSSQKEGAEGNPLKGIQGEGDLLKGIHTPHVSEKNPSSRTESNRTKAAARILAHLNDITGAKFEAAPATLKEIEARLREVNDEQGIVVMLDRQNDLWKHDPHMRKYLRPETLFNSTKFHSYYGQRQMPLEQVKAQSTKPNAVAINARLQIVNRKLQEMESSDGSPDQIGARRALMNEKDDLEQKLKEAAT